MPTLRLAQQLKQFAEEVLEVSKDFWVAQSQSKGKKQPEITETEFLALDILTRSGQLTVGDIQRQIGVLPAQMSRIVRSLEHKGDAPLIRCTINPQDKRKIDVELTEAGRQMHQTYREIKLGNIEKMLASMNEHDRNELMRILRVIRENFRKPLTDKGL